MFVPPARRGPLDGKSPPSLPWLRTPPRSIAGQCHFVANLFAAVVEDRLFNGSSRMVEDSHLPRQLQQCYIGCRTAESRRRVDALRGYVAGTGSTGDHVPVPIGKTSRRRQTSPCPVQCNVPPSEKTRCLSPRHSRSKLLCTGRSSRPPETGRDS